MKHLKTYEQIQDFYSSDEKRYLLVTKDEKYAPYINKLGQPYHILIPVSDIENNAMKFSKTKDEIDSFKEMITSGSYWIYIKASDYAKNPVNLHNPDHHFTQIPALFGDEASGSAFYDIDDFDFKDDLDWVGSVNKLFIKSINDENNDKLFIKVDKNIEYKTIEFIVGLGRNEYLDI